MTVSTESIIAKAVKVTRTEQRVYLDGIQCFGPSQCASSVHGCQSVILKALGIPISYDDLLCLSGFAFRAQVHEQMCPSAGHPCCGYACVAPDDAETAWHAVILQSGDPASAEAPPPELESKAYAAIKKSIDEGIPVQYGSEEDGLIIGYADEGRRWWCLHPYFQNGQQAFWHDEASGFAGGKWPWGIAIYSKPETMAESPTPTERVANALHRASDAWLAKKRGAYLLGPSSYRHWLKWLREVDTGKVSEPQSGMQGNGWCFDVLIHSRRIASRWLFQQAELFAPPIAKNLRHAAACYQKIATECMEGLDCPWDLALGPQRLEQWTSALRKDQIRRLESALGNDQSAMSAIKEAIGEIDATDKETVSSTA